MTDIVNISKLGPVGTVVVAAGQSLRMSGVNKIFAILEDRPLIAHCLTVLNDFPLVSEIVLVLSPDLILEGYTMASKFQWPKLTKLCKGGLRRQDSVKIGLDALSSTPWVMIHDGARPFIDSELLYRGMDAVRHMGAATAAIPSKDTIKIISTDQIVSSTPPRETVWATQTPQLFESSLINKAHSIYKENFTDDSSMIETLGLPVKIFMGSYSNIKITTQEDLVLARMILQNNIRGMSKS
jgi:2-C-methyl-D-erythritol 4-phosphate cytidylyltransferase